MKVVIGADHGGLELKETIKTFLKAKGFEVQDVGANSMDPLDDYTDFAQEVAKKVSAAEQRKLFQEDIRGILLCRSAGGMVIAANKFKNVRAIAAMDEKSARHSREHNAANVIAISGDWTNEQSAKKIAKVFLDTPFSNDERHVRRLLKIHDNE